MSLRRQPFALEAFRPQGLPHCSFFDRLVPSTLAVIAAMVPILKKSEIVWPLDFVMLECGQYNELWKDIHMMPEQTVQAAIDLKAKLMMPIHWGAFTLCTLG